MQGSQEDRETEEIPGGPELHEVREAYRGRDPDAPKKKRGPKKKAPEVEPEIAFTPEAVEDLVCLPLNMLFSRLETDELNVEERLVLARAAAPVMTKYGNWVAPFAPEAFLAMVLFSIFEPRIKQMKEKRARDALGGNGGRSGV